MLQWAQAVYGAPSSYLWAIARTNYYNDRRAARDASPEAVLEAMRADSDNGRTYTTRLKQVADQFGLQLVNYETDPDNGGGSTVNIGNRILANRLPAMREVMVRDVRDNWFELGGGLYMLLELSSAYSRFGCWGQNEDVIDSEARTGLSSIRSKRFLSQPERGRSLKFQRSSRRFHTEDTEGTEPPH